MPTYEFRCSSCGHTFDELLKIAEREQPLKEPCPSCSKECVESVLCAPNIGDAIRMGITKIDSRLKERYASIKRHFPGSTIKD